MKKLIYVVGWEYEGGGGFDWYDSIEFAAGAWYVEKRNAKQFSDQEWRAYRFTLEIPSDMSTHHVTMHVEAYLQEHNYAPLCESFKVS